LSLRIIFSSDCSHSFINNLDVRVDTHELGTIGSFPWSSCVLRFVDNCWGLSKGDIVGVGFVWCSVLVGWWVECGLINDGGSLSKGKIVGIFFISCSVLVSVWVKCWSLVNYCGSLLSKSDIVGVLFIRWSVLVSVWVKCWGLVNNCCSLSKS